MQLPMLSVTPSAPVGGGGGGGGGGGATPLSVSLNTTNAFGADSITPIFTDSVIGTISGGTGPYTSSWAVTGAGISASSPASPSTSFKGTFKSGIGGTRTGTAVLTVTDSSVPPVSKDSATVNISITYSP